MMNISYTARQLFQNHSGKEVISLSEVRWYYRYKCVSQIFDNSATVDYVISSDEKFSNSLRLELNELIKPPILDDLRLEFALAKDTGDSLVKLCYCQEGDDAFMSVSTYDHWMSVMNKLNTQVRSLLPNVVQIAATLTDNIALQNEHIMSAAGKVRPVYEKMNENSNNRLQRTLRIFRACRMFNYKFIAKESIITL